MKGPENPISTTDSWQSLVECTGLENQQGVKSFIGSNPILSATFSLLRGLNEIPFFMFVCGLCAVWRAFIGSAIVNP